MTSEIVVLGPYATTQGLLRILVEVEGSVLDDLQANLSACALLADDLLEFKSLALRAIADVGGVFGEFMSGMTSNDSLRLGIRQAAEQSDPLAASRAFLAAVREATPAARAALLVEGSYQAERMYLSDLLTALDEFSVDFATSLCGLLKVSVARLQRALE
jgi:hypothetical protein